MVLRPRSIAVTAARVMTCQMWRLMGLRIRGYMSGLGVGEGEDTLVARGDVGREGSMGDMGWARVVGACPSRKACAVWREFKPLRGSCCMTWLPLDIRPKCHKFVSLFCPVQQHSVCFCCSLSSQRWSQQVAAAGDPGQAVPWQERAQSYRWYRPRGR